MIGVVIASYGNEMWRDVARRAVDSVKAQTLRTSWVHMHDTNGHDLHVVRNQAAAQLFHHRDVTRLVFLDADDELDREYIEYMEMTSLDPDVIVKPSCLNLNDGPNIPEELKDLHTQNWLPIGCVMSRSFFERSGGFEGWPVLEDWAFWLRAEHFHGAHFEICKQATYIIHNDGEERRNPSNGSDLSNYWAAQIRRCNGSYAQYDQDFKGAL